MVCRIFGRPINLEKNDNRRSGRWMWQEIIIGSRNKYLYGFRNGEEIENEAESFDII